MESQQELTDGIGTLAKLVNDKQTALSTIAEPERRRSDVPLVKLSTIRTLGRSAADLS